MARMDYAMREEHSRQTGLGLIELMIAITIGLIVTAGVMQVFVSTLVGSRDLLDQARLENELNNILHWMSSDIRRAGYWGPEGQFVDWAEDERNPFTETVNGINHRLNVSEQTGQTANSCALYTYNLDGDTVDDGDAGDARIGFCTSCAAAAPFNVTATYDQGNMEMFGYRLSGGVVEMREGPESGDTTFSCDAGDWEPLSDSGVVTITGLTFTLTPNNINTVSATSDAGVTTTLTVETLQVDIQLSGQLANDAAVTKSLTTSVKVANNLVRE
ncbi:MAG: prepilin-type N-terminal cleavage/methylation domain-containing protein [Amphritea sp.]